MQIPCIERNAIGAVKSINAARMAKMGEGTHHVTLDNAVQTMAETGRDMLSKYKETSLGGLAKTMGFSVSQVECSKELYARRCSSPPHHHYRCGLPALSYPRR